MRRSVLAFILCLVAAPAYAQQWDQVNGSMQVRSGPSAPLVIIDQTAASQKIASYRANGTEKCSIDTDGDLVCVGTFTLTGQFLGGDGTAAAPSYSFSSTGNGDNGMFLSAANVLGFSAAGTERVTISASATNIVVGELQTAGNRVGYNLSAYGVGTVYALTNTAAAIDFGTTDPVKVLDKAGTYLVFGQVHLTYTGATVVAETATIKVRRTNNTAADLSAVVVLDLPVATTLTHTYGIFQIPPFLYTTAATDDSITLFANVSAALSVGTIDATAIGTSIVVVRLY